MEEAMMMVSTKEAQSFSFTSVVLLTMMTDRKRNRHAMEDDDVNELTPKENAANPLKRTRKFCINLKFISM
jgi:hypothetical protein